jgi:hypothetical protein
MAKKFFKFLLPLIIVTVICSFAFADLGNFNDYSSSDYGGGRDSYSSNGGDYSDSWHSDSSENTYFFGLNTSSDIHSFIVIIAIFFIILAYRFIMDKAENKTFGTHTAQNNTYNGLPDIPDNTHAIAKAIMEIDLDFSADKFLAWAKEVFITLQTAWSERDWEKVRPFETEELYRQHQLQIQEYIDKGRINVLERININNAYFYRYKRDEQYEYLAVYMNVRMIDYIIDEKTRQVLKGTPDKDCFLRYILTFIRKKGILTSAQAGISVVACPECGAPVRATSAGKCDYCGFIVKTGDYSWVLADIEGVKPGIKYDSGGVITDNK